MTAAPVLAKTLKYKLTVSSGENAGQSFAFEKPLVVIGRGPENDMVFANDPKMSRTHVELRHLNGQIIARNISQKNLMFVNGERVEEKTLVENSILQIGETVLQFQSEAAAIPAPVVKVVAAPPARTASTPPPASKKQEFFQTQTSSHQISNPVAPQAPPAPPRPPRPSRAMPMNTGGNSRLRFYMIVLGIGGLIAWMVATNSNPKKTESQLRTEGDVVRAIEDSAKAVQELRKQQESTGQDSLQYRAAQEHYIKGFRDYRQGQFARAMQSFQAALSFYPNHELARKYLLQAQRKFDAQIDFNLAQGRKYYQKQNYKMCQSAFASVMMMVKDSTKLKYKEAKQLYDECGLRLEGSY